MKIAFFTNIISPHQIPLAKEIVARNGLESYTYVYTIPVLPDRVGMGWGCDTGSVRCVCGDADTPALREADVLISGNRAVELFERRAASGKATIYVSERWFKPPYSWLRLLSPGYFRMAKRIVKLLDDPHFYYFPMGVHAAVDMLRLYGILHGKLQYLFRAPKVAFESRPAGAVVPLGALDAKKFSSEERNYARRYGFLPIPEKQWGTLSAPGIFRKLRMWGYFVSPSTEKFRQENRRYGRRILWMGRMLDWKNVKTLIKAVKQLPESANASLDIYGNGPEKTHLLRLAGGSKNITFHEFVGIDKVREIMREHDIYVLPSTAGEGWGAVVNEAWEEKMSVLASTQTGAGATILPIEAQFDAGSVAQLREKLLAPAISGENGWTATQAAENLLRFVQGKE